MNQLQARQALNEGLKLRHLHFLDGEYVYKKDGLIFDEQNIPFEENMFWKLRTDKNWQENWYEYAVRTPKNIVTLQLLSVLNGCSLSNEINLSLYNYEQATLKVEKAKVSPNYKPCRNLHNERVSKRKTRRNNHKYEK